MKKSKNSLDISENTSIGIELKSLIGIISAVAVAVWAYFGIIEKLNQHESKLMLMEDDVTQNSEFRIKWPRGLLGSLPADSEQFMLIENLFKDIEKIKVILEQNMTNKVNIEFIQKQIQKLLIDVEKLKDAQREIKFSNGNGTH